MPTRHDEREPSAEDRPRLVFFFSRTSGRSRIVEAHLAQVLQRRHNHQTFVVHQVPQEERPDLHERFKIAALPTLMIVDGKRVHGTLVQPRGTQQIIDFLSPWLV
jgi:hypothetical protein